MAGKTAFISQPNRRIGLKKVFDQRQNFRHRFAEIAAGGQRTGQTIERGSALFAAAFRLFALAQLRGEMADDERDDEIRTEHHHILKLADVKSEAWRNIKKIPEQRAQVRDLPSRPSSRPPPPDRG